MHVYLAKKKYYSKSKAIWTGSKTFSRDVYHHTRWKLKWGTTESCLLGIKVSVNLKHISKLNYDTKLVEFFFNIKI